MGALLNDNGLAPCSEEVFSKLLSKHPQEPNQVSDEKIREMFDFVVAPEDKISVNKELVREIVGNWKTLVRCGPDKLRNEHLKMLIGHHLKDQEAFYRPFSRCCAINSKLRISSGNCFNSA